MADTFNTGIYGHVPGYDAPNPGYDANWNWKTVSTEPGHVGTWVGADNGGFKFNPSKYDFSDLTYLGPNNSAGYQSTFMNPEGNKEGYNPDTTSLYQDKKGGILAYDLANDTFLNYRPGVADIDINSLPTNFQGYKYYVSPQNQGGYTFQNQSNIPIVGEQVYWLDPSSNKLVPPSGNFLLNQPRSSGGFDDWMTENGWIAPLAMIGAGAGLSALGGEAAAGGGAAGAEAGAGAGAGDVFAGYSATGSAAGTAGTTVPAGYGAAGAAGALTDANLGYTGAAQELGLEGSTSGLTDLSGAQGSELLNSMGLNTSGMSASEILSTANRARQMASLLNNLTGGQATSKAGTSLPTAQQFAQFSSLNQPVQQQFGGLYETNKSPFTFSNPLAAALKGKDATGLDVSGTGGQALNTQNQALNLAKLLA